jgi:hypothetical protein
MMNRNLSRRLERLEEQLAPLEVLTVLQFVGVSPDGSRTKGPRFEVKGRRPIQRPKASGFRSLRRGW